mmetsp:Transcript_16876/g.49124  ORF Transcript_16876/g.49124 Transcript_16876/m.49124 type:complete len:260 (+) Transcript_16876:1046-1825(+)
MPKTRGCVFRACFAQSFSTSSRGSGAGRWQNVGEVLLEPMRPWRCSGLQQTRKRPPPPQSTSTPTTTASTLKTTLKTPAASTTVLKRTSLATRATPTTQQPRMQPQASKKDTEETWHPSPWMTPSAWRPRATRTCAKRTSPPSSKEPTSMRTRPNCLAACQSGKAGLNRCLQSRPKGEPSTSTSTARRSSTTLPRLDLSKLRVARRVPPRMTRSFHSIPSWLTSPISRSAGCSSPRFSSATTGMCASITPMAWSVAWMT